MKDFSFLKDLIKGRNDFIEDGHDITIVTDQFDEIFDKNYEFPLDYYFKISIEDFEEIFKEIDYECEALTSGITYRLPQNLDGTYKGLYLTQKDDLNKSICSFIEVQNFQNGKKYIELPIYKLPDEIPELTTLLKKNIQLASLLWKVAEVNFEKRYLRRVVLEEKIQQQKEKIEFLKATNSDQREIKILENKLKSLEDKLKEETERFNKYADDLSL